MYRWLAIGVFVACKSSSTPLTGSGSASGAPPKSIDAPVVAVDAAVATKPPPSPTLRPGGPGDCKPDYAPKPDRDPNPMCKVAGGAFEMGDHRKVELSPFVLDEFEVTNAQIQFFLETTHADESCKDCFIFDANPPAPVRKADGAYTLDPALAKQPYTWARREGAVAYCTWAGKQLPTEAQFEFVARFDPTSKRARAFPWGDAMDPKRARCDCGGPAKGLVDVGSFDGANGAGDGRSPWGPHDLAGNAREWIADCNLVTPRCDGTCKDPVDRGDGTKCRRAYKGGASDDPDLDMTRVQDGLDHAGIRCAIGGAFPPDLHK